MSENATDITNDNIQDNNGNDSLLTGGSLYESSTDKYKDNLSSAITFFVCGGIGIILMILNDIGIIKIITKDALILFLVCYLSDSLQSVSGL